MTTEITRVTVGMLATNCYIVRQKGRNDGVVIDPGADYEKIDGILSDIGVSPSAVLLTHAHFDHCNAALYFQRRGCKVYLHSADRALTETDMNCAEAMGARFLRFVPDVLIGHDETVEESGMSFRVLHTPGHTAGSVCYVLDRTIFSGDTLFCMSVGRTDLPTGSGFQLRASVRERLFALSGDYLVYPGHGEPTTLEFERQYNPYV